MSEVDWALFCWCGERFAALSADWDAELAGWEWAWEWRTTAATHAGAHYLALAPQLRACSAALDDDAELARRFISSHACCARLRADERLRRVSYAARLSSSERISKAVTSRRNLVAESGSDDTSGWSTRARWR